MIRTLYTSIYLSIPRWVTPRSRIVICGKLFYPVIPSCGAMVKKIKKKLGAKKSKGLSAGKRQ